MVRKSRVEDICFAVGVLVISWVMLFSKAPYRLDFKEQISIFLLGADRVNWYLSNPAVVSSVVGDWLTQFYTVRFMAATLSVLLLAAVYTGLVRFFRLSEPERPDSLVLMAVPILFEGYFIPFPNYPVSATVGLAVSIWAACALAHLKDSKLGSVIYGLSVPIIFVIAGSHALTMALLLAFLKRKDGISSIISVAAGIVLMMIAGRLYNLTLLQTFLFPVYPGYINPHNSLMMLIPWIALAVTILSLYYDRYLDSVQKNWMLPVVLIICTSVSSVLRNDELERTVKIGTLAYRNEWKEVKKMASSDKSCLYKNYYWNLCNAREGRLADGLLEGGWGRSSDILFLSTTKGDPYFSMMYFTDALLEIGDVSQATDCALLAQTIMPGHYSTRMLRRLAQIAVVTADYDVARKYLNILMRTRNHKAWARNLMDCIESDNIPEQYLTWRSRTAPVDRFFGQGDTQSSLSIIAKEVPYNNVAIDYLLCSCLLDKKINTFISLYNEYYLDALDRIVKVPDLYQEALLVNVNSKESLIETVQKYHLSQKVVDNYVNLLDARAKSENPQNLLTKDAVGTYWNYIMAVRFNNAEQ